MGGFFSSSMQAQSLSSPTVSLEEGRNNRRNNSYSAKAPRVNSGSGQNIESPSVEGRTNNGAAAPKRPNNTNRNKNRNLERGNNSRRANNVAITVQPNNRNTLASNPESSPNSPNNMAGGRRKKSRRSSGKHRRHTKKH